jgi:hypothetical protein
MFSLFLMSSDPFYPFILARFNQKPDVVKLLLPVASPPCASIPDLVADCLQHLCLITTIIKHRLYGAIIQPADILF